MIQLKSIKVQINLFLAAFALFLFIREPRPAMITGFFWAILFSGLLDATVLFFKTRKFQITDSALTSGLILGFVFSAESPWWIFLAVADFTIVL